MLRGFGRPKNAATRFVSVGSMGQRTSLGELMTQTLSLWRCRVKKTLWCLAVLACVTALAAWAAEPAKPAAAPAMTVQEKAALARQVDLFTQIAAAGETEKDPLLLLSAVRLLEQIPPSAGIAKPGATDKSKFTREALLNEAKEYAAGDAELLSVIAKLQDAPEPTAVRGWRHHGDGPGYYYDRRYHHRRFGCDWVRECGRHGCDWVCRGEGRHRDWD